MTGPFATIGGPQREGIEVGIEYVNNSDEFDFEFDPVYEDTETSAAVGRRRAQRLVEEEGADFIAGTINSSVVLAVAEYCGNNEVVYAGGGASMQLTGESCNQYTFRNETNAEQQATGVSEWIIDQGYETVWIHYADYAYGNSASKEIRSALEGSGIEVVGSSAPSQGTSNFAPYISQISESDAEVLAVPLTGGDLINFIGQAVEAGLKDEVDIIGTAIFARFVRGALGGALHGTYSSALYDASLDVGDNQQFVSSYEEMHGNLPGSFARVGYETVRLIAEGIQAAGTTDPTEVATTLEGLEVETVLGTTAFRECDHQTPNPVWPSEVVPPSGDGEVPELDIIEKIPKETTTGECNSACEM
jgi:branched-chain amino acid transport system substrate-binding protein